MVRKSAENKIIKFLSKTLFTTVVIQHQQIAKILQVADKKALYSEKRYDTIPSGRKFGKYWFCVDKQAWQDNISEL